MRARRSLPLPQSTLGRPWVWPARKWNPCASEARNSAAKRQERGTAHVSSRKTNLPHSTSDNAFQLLFSFFCLFWIICLTLQKYILSGNDRTLHAGNNTYCVAWVVCTLACTLDWEGVLCVLHRSASNWSHWSFPHGSWLHICHWCVPSPPASSSSSS